MIGLCNISNIQGSANKKMRSDLVRVTQLRRAVTALESRSSNVIFKHHSSMFEQSQCLYLYEASVSKLWERLPFLLFPFLTTLTLHIYHHIYAQTCTASEMFYFQVRLYPLSRIPHIKNRGLNHSGITSLM